MTFTKLFSSITESTVWCENDQTRIVWITMLAMANKNGFVFGSIPGLANRARVPVEAAREAILKFQQPDLDSRTKDFEGRRIEEIDGGWRLINYSKHRAIRDEEERREYMANLMRKKRSVSKVSRSEPSLAQAEAEAEADKNTKPSARKLRRAQGKPNSTQTAKASGETRHARSQQIVQGWYRDWAGVDCPWDGSEGSNLSKILKAWPSVTDEQFSRCLDHIEKSDCIPKGTRPCEWLCKLPKFLDGPLDQFWKTKGAGNGNGNNKSVGATRDANNVEALVRSGLGKGL